MRLGIDFGTTRTVVAYCDRGNYPLVSFTDDSGDAVEWFPTVVAERGGELRFGFDALAVVASDPTWTLARSFKRWISDPLASPEMVVRVGSLALPATQLLAAFMSALREALLNESSLAHTKARTAKVLRAVVAVPANAHSTQRFLTLDGFRRAGFEVLAMLNEPSAAGFEYTHHHRDTLTPKREHVVVYDLGGGTFDASLVRMAGRHHDALMTAGINRLGGDDFDTVLLDLVVAAGGIDREALPARALDALTDQCRTAKEGLNPNSRRLVVDVEAALGETAPCREVTVAANDYYAACEPLIERTIGAMSPVMHRLENEDPSSPIAGADGEAPTDEALASIAGIYVVGGGSTLPAVARVLRTRFGRRVHRSPYPSAATAIGLAIASDEGAAFRLTDRFSRNFGVFREARAGHEVTFDPILTPDMLVPGGGADPVVSRRVYRAVHNVGHFRFVECAALTTDGAPVGDIAPFADVYFPFDTTLRDDAVDLRSVRVERNTNPGPLVQEQYAVGSHGIVEVTITDLETGYTQSYRLNARTDRPRAQA